MGGYGQSGCGRLMYCPRVCIEGSYRALLHERGPGGVQVRLDRRFGLRQLCASGVELRPGHRRARWAKDTYRRATPVRQFAHAGNRAAGRLRVARPAASTSPPITESWKNTCETP